MIKTLPILLILLMCNLCYGQRYKRCTVFCKNHHDSKKNGIALRQLFNNKDRIVYEREYGREEGRTYPDSGLNYSDTNYVRSETFYYYMYDTILIKKIKQEKSMWEENELGIDTFASLYFYNNKNLLDKEVNASYTIQVRGCIPDRLPPKWGDSTVTFYKYNNNGNIIEKYTTRLNTYPTFDVFPSPNRSFYNYKNGRLEDVSNYYYGHDTALISRDIYTYFPTKYTIHRIPVRWIGHETESREYEIDSIKRVIHEWIIIEAWERIDIRRSFIYNPQKRIEKEIYAAKETRTYVYE